MYPVGVHVYLCACIPVSFFTSAIGLFFFLNMPLDLLIQTLFRSLDNFSLVVVLFFILCGNIMSKGKTVEKLINLANSLVSWLPGGLGMAGVIGVRTFRGHFRIDRCHGGGPGRVHDPGIDENGYDERYTLGLMTTSPNLGVIIPPSISMIFIL